MFSPPKSVGPYKLRNLSWRLKEGVLLPLRQEKGKNLVWLCNLYSALITVGSGMPKACAWWKRAGGLSSSDTLLCCRNIMINNNKIFVKRKILSIETILSAYTREHTHTHTHRGTRTHEHSEYKAKFTQNGQQTETWDGWRQAARNRKHGRSAVLGKYIFRLHLNESREGLCWRGRSFHVDGPKTEKAREPMVESRVRGI